MWAVVLLFNITYVFYIVKYIHCFSSRIKARIKTKFSLAYRIPVQLSFNRCLFPDPLCISDFGTTCFRSLPVPDSSLRTGFRYNFLPIAAYSQIPSAYRIPVQLSSDCCLFPDPLCVPDSGTTFFRSLPIPRSSLRTGFRYNFLPIAARSQILPAYRIPVQLSSDRRLFPDLLLRTGFRYVSNKKET